MKEQERQQVVTTLTKRIQKDGYIKLSALKGVFVQEGLDIALYPTSGPKKWITDNFPEFMIMGNNGYECIRMKDDMVARSWAIIEREIVRNGKVLIATIPGILSNSNDHINYKALANGQRLVEWLRSSFPDFKISEDNLWLSHTKESAEAATDISSPGTGAANEEEVMHTEGQLAEIQQMHNVAYMNWWNLNIRKIKVYNEDISEEEAKNSIAHQMSQILMGMTDGLINGMEEEDPKIALDTGLLRKNSTDHIYCILKPNPRYENGEKQKYVQSGFCCMDDGTDEGNWVKEHLQAVTPKVSFLDLEKKAVAVSEEMIKIRAVLENYLEQITAGKMPADKIAGTVTKFEDTIAEMRNMYTEVLGKSLSEDVPISQVVEMASGKNVLTQQMSQAIQDFAEIAEKTHEYFETYSVIDDEDSTPLHDKQKILEEYATINENVDFEDFLSVLRYYRCLRDVMAARNVVSDGVEEKIDSLSEHFHEINFRIAAKILVGAEPEEMAYLNRLDSIENQVNEWKKISESAGAGTDTVAEVLSPEQLLEMNQTVGKDIVAINQLTHTFCQNHDIVKKLILGEWNSEMTFWAAAQRIYGEIGNYERIAESYYILGLLFDEEKNFHALLQLYTEEKNDEGFIRIFNEFSNENSLSVEEQMKYLSIMKTSNPASALAYLREHCYLWYQKESMELLLSLPEDILKGDERGKLEQRIRQFDYVNHMNPLEQAIRENDRDAIHSIISQENALAGMGYSEEEIEKIRACALESDEREESEEDEYEIGVRFYQYQGNKHSLAEYYMWRGIAEDKEVLATPLMKILAEESRWEECGKLYEGFRAIYSENSECRKFYLLTKIHCNPISAEEYICNNLQECLAFMSDDSGMLVRETIAAQSVSDNREIAQFYTRIIQFGELLADPLARSIICLERSLREYADPVVAKKMGVAEKYAAVINSVYRADSYPHGMDAYSIACRAFKMVGTYREIAEKFAKFALPDISAVRLLWEIYEELEDENSQLSLLQEYAVLKDEHREHYLNLLFRKERYVEFMAECAMEPQSWGRTLQLFIAELKVVPENQRISMPEISYEENPAEEQSWYEDWGALLTKTLYECQRLADVETLLFTKFSNWTKSYTAELVRDLVTGKGVADKESLSMIQKQAWEAGQKELAIYLCNVLQVGELSELEPEYLENVLKELEQIPFSDRLNSLRRLRIIYGDSMQQLDGEIDLLEIRQVLENDTMDSESKSAVVSEILNDFPQNEEMRRQLILLLHEMTDDGDVLSDVELQRMIYSLYNDAMQHGIFPDEIIPEIEEKCIADVHLSHTVESTLCLYYIKVHANFAAGADYLLRVLADYAPENMDEKTGKTIKDLLNQTWENNIPSYFELFKNVLNNMSIEEINEYLKFVCNVSSNPLMDESEQLLDGDANRMWSEDESNMLVQYLCCNPENPDIWKKSASLPIQDNPVAYAKLLYMDSVVNPGDSQKCASYCEKYEQNELLLTTLLTWSKADSKKCRKYVENRLNDNPEYLSIWKERPELLEFVKNVCEMQQSEYEQENHTYLRASCLIAEKCSNPEALKFFLEEYKAEIFERNCNLGVVLSANLILDQRYEEAGEILSQLKNVLSYMNFKKLVDSLAVMNTSELAEWSENIENRMMLQLILPDGNVPSLDQINDFTDAGIVNGQVKETIQVIKRILSMFRDDYGAYNALFNLCCTDPEAFVPELHMSLRGLRRLRPSKNAVSYYRRKQEDYAGMLSVLNELCIKNQWMDRIEDYDFSIDTGNTSVADTFCNRSEAQIRMLTKAYLSAITGNWYDLILEAWEKKEDISFEINVTAGTKANNMGLIRSVLRVLLDVEKEHRKKYLDWIHQMVMIGASGIRTERYREIEFVKYFYRNNFFTVLEEQNEFEPLSQILRHPFEDYSLSEKWEKRYINAALKMNLDVTLLSALVLMIGALVKHPYFQSQLAKRADIYFDRGNDTYACVFYHALYELNRYLYLHHDPYYGHKDYTDISPARRKTGEIRLREMYEVRYRITALFSNEQSIMKKVGNPHFHVWSCINMVLSLMYSERADELLRLASYMDQNNKQLVEDMITAFNPGIIDEQKLMLIDNRKDDLEKVYFCYVVKYPYNPANKMRPMLTSYALTDANVKQSYNREFMRCVKTLEQEHNPYVNGARPARVLLTENKSPEEKTFQQKDPSIWNILEKAKVQEKVMTENEIPFFAKSLNPQFCETEVEKLKNKRENMQNLAGVVKDKLELSTRIYQHDLAENVPMETLNDALLMLGNDFYYSAVVDGRNEDANRALFEIVRILKYRKTTEKGAEEARRTIQEGLLMLFKSVDDLQYLLDSYGEHKGLFQYMRSVITDPLVGACVTQVFHVLESLRNSYASDVQDNQEILREELSLNYRKLEEIETNRWMEIKNKVQKLINDEINELDLRPVLQFTVLNSGSQSYYGKLFGEVHNIGKVAAENIVIQASYSDNSSSNQYVLKKLSPRGKAVFELDYSFADKMTQADYFITATFGYSEKTHSSTVCKGTLELEKMQEPDYPTGLLTQYADGIMFKTNEETGEVYSPEFVGRKNETAMLRNLVAGENFEDYKSALMYGVRRTGKTSLLNYLEAYIGLNCDNVICVKTDCQSIPGKSAIQYVFIDRVIDTVERKMPGVKTEPGWSELKKTWGNEYFSADQQPERLSLFYMDVKSMIGDKGVFLIIDEIDRLFERIEQTQMNYHRNLDSLFGAISEILNSIECRKAVHLVICGSNWLIRYNLKGDRKNQLFQRFGKQVIEVGKLPENDASEIVYMPYRQYPELTITEEAVEWIWDYAGGLVWHTKLLGEEAVERAKQDHRYVVYPSDVRQSMPKVVTDLWCKQFYEGCEDGEERDLVDAMQSLAAKKDAYVHVNQLSELMGRPKVEIQRIINVLVGLKILSAHPIEPQMYRFELDIYRRYFRTNPSAYEQVAEEPDIFQIRPSERGMTDHDSKDDDDSDWFD